MINPQERRLKNSPETPNYQGSRRSESSLNFPLATLATPIARRFARTITLNVLSTTRTVRQIMEKQR